MQNIKAFIIKNLLKRKYKASITESFIKWKYTDFSNFIPEENQIDEEVASNTSSSESSTYRQINYEEFKMKPSTHFFEEDEDEDQFARNDLLFNEEIGMNFDSNEP